MNRILILSSNPKNTTRLRLDEEVREIEEGFKRAKIRDKFDIKTKWATRPTDMQRAILEEKPNIIHFSGHGVGQQGLVLEDKVGKAKIVSTKALSKLFELFSDYVECVVLNACYSEKQADAIVKYIPYVVGMSHEISDQSSLEFSLGFYDALGAGEGIDFAFKLGCSYIRMSGREDSAVPMLIKSDAKPKYGILTRQDRIEEELKSEVGINYKRLRKFLKDGSFKKADIETYVRLLEIAGRNKGDKLRPKEIKNYPCTDLQTIDHLWQKYSNGRFGFTPQKKKCIRAFGKKSIKKIRSEVKGWDREDEEWESFLRKVGWRNPGTYGEPLDYRELTFNTSAKSGHLPAAYVFSSDVNENISNCRSCFINNMVSVQVFCQLEKCE